MDISNRTLGLLLIAAIVVSIGSTFFVLDNMSDNVVITGYLTSDDGNVSLDIKSFISIDVVDTSIDFGECTLNTSHPSNTTTFDSSLASSTINNTLCDMTWDSDFISVENDGTINVNLTVVSNATANSTYVNTAGSATTKSQYNVKVADNESSSCVGTLQSTYATLGTSPVNLCDDFSYADTSDLLNVYARVVIDNTARAQVKQAKWTFTGSNS
jgi:hypothetical protein